MKQHIGFYQLDHSAIVDNPGSELNDWWSGPDLLYLASASKEEIISHDLHHNLQEAISNVRKLRTKALHTLLHNKESNLLHDARMNSTRNISLRLNPKLMDEPEAHHVILNPTNIHEDSTTRCEYFQQCLDNTLLYHQNWMDRSGSDWEHHWFKLSFKYGHVAGIDFKHLHCPKPSDQEFKLLVKEHEKCSDEIRSAFQNAHSDAIFQLMRPPKHAHRELDWLWHPASTSEEWNSFESDYWKAISAIPGKARHAGYTMAVIGRLPRRWIDLHLRIMKLMMVLRILPQRTKIQSRVPIPKPKPGETRPLSLLHDDMCFILGFITKHYTMRIEKLQLFPTSLRAYRQGMGTSAITLLDLAMREDAVSFGRLMALTAEDEEKFFDRVSLEVQLAVLAILGFPTEGLIELKAEEMDNIVVEIQTRHGIIIGKFLHGLKQGSPFSVLVSNCTLTFKHRIWGLRDPEATTDDPNGYSMTIWNKRIDGPEPPIASTEGFCDDNSKWNMGNGRDFRTVVQAIQWNIKMAGDLSMIFKIGRRGDKTIIELFNVNYEDVHMLPAEGFTSIAWDFKANRPTLEEVDCRVYLVDKSLLPLEKPDTLSEQIWKMLIKGLSLKSERSLGIWRNQLADTSDSAKQRAYLLGQRIDRLNLSSIKNDKTIKLAVNSLVVPVYQFGILENKCCPDTFDAMDQVIVNKIRKATGYAWCDAKQLLFVSEKNFGMGINSVSVLMLKSIGRELEIQLNDDALIGKVLRGRLEAFKCDVNNNESTGTLNSYEFNTRGIRNFLMEGIRHIAAYGFFIRDMSDIKTSYQIESAIRLAQLGLLFHTFKHATLGMQEFLGTGSRSGTTLGAGDTRLLWGYIYGRAHMLLQPNAVTSNCKMNFSIQQLQLIHDDARSVLENDINALYTLFEWSATYIEAQQSTPVAIAQYCQSINDLSHWKRISAISCLRNRYEEQVHDSEARDDCSFLNSLLALERQELIQRIEHDYIIPNRLQRSQIEFLLSDGWPLIVATDGGAKHLQSKLTTCQCASAGTVIFRPPNIPFATYMAASKTEKTLFMNQNLIPWKARATPLPPSIGNCVTDNAHAECLALIILEEWIPKDTPVLLIMDSEAERERYFNLQRENNTTNRFLIRSIMSGVSKCLGSRLAQAISYHYQPCETISNIPAVSITNFYLHAKEWCFTDTGKESSWRIHQWDKGFSRTVWAIRSHQLEESFTISATNRYGSNIVPNRTFVSANQWADNICNAILRFQRNAFYSQCPYLRKWLPPKVHLGITGPLFILTLNGVCLDRSISDAIEEACDLEFVRRIAIRPTQGLLMRLRETLFLKPEMIGRHSYLRRSLEGKTKTHTRAMYTDSDYRKAIVHKHAKDESWETDSVRIAGTLKNATKCYAFLKCPCCDAEINATRSHLLDKNDVDVFPFPTTPNTQLHSGLYGNLRHYRFYCFSPNTQAIRYQMNQLLENHLGALFKIASHWGRLGFSTLLDRAIKALITLDRRPFHNAFKNDYSYMKFEASSFACITPEEWLTLLDSLPEKLCLFAHNSFRRWPLLHQLGFIPANCYTKFEMEDGEYSPCDLLSMGIIPLALHDVISQFATELGSRHCQDTKKDFLHQWQQVRAMALLRAVSMAMAAGAQVADYKKSLITTLPQSVFKIITNTVGAERSNAMPLNNASVKSSTLKSKPRGSTGTDQAECFPCIGITCSFQFSAKTNLRPSKMRKEKSVCRRCTTMRKAIDCAISIEYMLAANQDMFREFFTAIHMSAKLTVDVIISAISGLHPMPSAISPSYLKRSTKRNVFPTFIINAVRFLCGTFGWKLSEVPTSLDLAFNQAKDSDKSEQKKYCSCEASVPLFAIDSQSCCNICGGYSVFPSTASRIHQFTSSVVPTQALPARITKITTSCVKKHLMARINVKIDHPNMTEEKTKRPCNPNLVNNVNALKDITNIPNTSERRRSMARPNDSELGKITHVNHMLSNFTVSYFFKVFANRFGNILFTEFLFDFVKRDGGWKHFVASSRRERHYTQFFEQLLQPKSICIIPICSDTHWTILVRRYIGNSWKILFIDSIINGSDKRFKDWQALFFDEDLFSGEWIKVKILPQRELECGARACVHGVCFALARKKNADIIGDLSRFKDLSVRSRLMVSTICRDGVWSHQGWLSRIIGTEAQLLG